MRTNLIIVDDFYNNVDEVRKFALSQPFDVKGNYPGVRTGCLINDSTRENIQKIVEPHGGKIVDWLESDEYTGSFQMATSRERTWVHSDNVNNSYVHDSPNYWGGVLYLNPDAPLEGGTSFYRSKVNKSIYSLQSFRNLTRSNISDILPRHGNSILFVDPMTRKTVRRRQITPIKVKLRNPNRGDNV